METVRTKFIAALQSMQIRGGVLVALSGGADSVCLLDLFLWAKENGMFPYPVAAAHLNHHLRGKESDRDADFCEDLCRTRGVMLYTEDADIAALAKKENKGIEEAARDKRYAFFHSVLAQDQSLCYIATAHHLGDFCETMLLNLIRGSGITGLCSIPQRRDAILRPLLECSREEILTYNRARGLSFVTDSTNASVQYSRNRIRLRVLPEFAKISSGYDRSMQRTAALLASDADYLQKEAEAFFPTVVTDGVLDTKKAQNLHLAMLSRIVKMLYTPYGSPPLAEVHIQAICKQITLGKENFTLSLPDCTCTCTRGALTFVREISAPAAFSFPITVEKEVALPTGITVLLSETDAPNAIPLCKDALQGELTVRSRNEGDVIRQFGKTHKIKRMIADKKLSAAEKEKLFFLTANETVVYTNLPAVSDKAFCKGGDKPCIFIITKETL